MYISPKGSGQVNSLIICARSGHDALVSKVLYVLELLRWGLKMRVQFPNSIGPRLQIHDVAFQNAA